MPARTASSTKDVEGVGDQVVEDSEATLPPPTPPPPFEPVPGLDIDTSLYSTQDRYRPKTLTSASEAFWQTVAKSARIYPDTVDTSIKSKGASAKKGKSWRPKRTPNQFADAALELESDLIANELTWSSQALALKDAIMKQTPEQQQHNRKFIQSFLTELHLRQLKIGYLDSAFMNFDHLKELTISGNFIDDLTNLPVSVEVLHASANEISGLPLFEGQAIRHLGLSHNRITDDSLQTFWQSMPYLVSLDLSFNQICDLGGAVNVLQQLPKLRSLCLMGNPCALQAGYRSYVLTSLTEIVHFDGTVVSHTDRSRDHIVSVHPDVDLRVELRRLVLNRLPPPKSSPSGEAGDNGEDSDTPEPLPEPEYGVWIDVAGHRFKSPCVELLPEDEEVDDSTLQEGECHPMDLKYRAHATLPISVEMCSALQYCGFVMYLVQVIRFDKEPKEEEAATKKGAKGKGGKGGKQDKGKKVGGKGGKDAGKKGGSGGAGGKGSKGKGSKKQGSAGDTGKDAADDGTTAEPGNDGPAKPREPIIKVMAFTQVKASAFVGDKPVTQLSGKAVWKPMKRLNDLLMTSTHFDPIVNPDLLRLPDEDLNERIPDVVAIGRKPPSHILYEFTLHAVPEPLIPEEPEDDEVAAKTAKSKAKDKKAGEKKKKK